MGVLCPVAWCVAISDRHGDDDDDDDDDDMYAEDRGNIFF
jgi:hypothetical protein